MKKDFKHIPVLLKEVLSFLPPPKLFHNKWILDATFGAGGHTKAILDLYPSCSVIALDQDLEAIKWARENIKPHFPKLHLIHDSFHHYPQLIEKKISTINKEKNFSAILLDLGVSSPQLDEPQRGFSFYKDGPLDMRMNKKSDLSAKDIINQWSKKDLENLFYEYGEIHHPVPFVKALLQKRKKSKLKTTKELADLVLKVTGWRKKGVHPATPYFLALRLKVNNELEGLRENLPKIIRSLKPKGVIFVITFHSLEDRIVKNIFKEASLSHGSIITKKVIKASREEIKLNPRSRSAKLRVFRA